MAFISLPVTTPQKTRDRPGDDRRHQAMNDEAFDVPIEEAKYQVRKKASAEASSPPKINSSGKAIASPLATGARCLAHPVARNLFPLDFAADQDGPRPSERYKERIKTPSA